MADIDSITHLVQQALTPAFLLSGAGTVMVVLSSRLARIVDRGHHLHDLMLVNKNKNLADELKIVDKRCEAIHHSFYFCVIAAFCICSVIVMIYVGKIYVDSEMSGKIIGWLFATAMISLTISLLLLLKEIRLCARSIHLSANKTY